MDCVFFARLQLNSLPSRTLLYVPGNHDVNLRLAASARIQLAPDEKTGNLGMTISDKIQQPELTDYAYTPFLNFLAEINDCQLLSPDIKDQSLAWVESRFRHLGVVFYGVNTAQPVSPFGIPGRKINPDALAKIGEELNKIASNFRHMPHWLSGWASLPGFR